MASLSEMMQYAEYKGQQDNPLVGAITNGIGGFFAGRSEARKQRTAQIDTALKLIDLQEKLQKIETEKQNMVMQQNVAKALGFMPHDANDLNAARDVALGWLGEGKNPPKVNTPAGKLNMAYEMASREDYAMAPSYSSKGGFGFTLKAKPKTKGKAGDMTESQQVALREKTYNLAAKMAASEYADTLRGRNPLDIQQLMAGFRPSQDSIQKFIPIAEKYLTGDKRTAGALYKERKQEYDPFGVFKSTNSEE